MDEIISLLNSLNGVLKVKQLSKKDILNIIDLESQRSKEMIPVFNRGVQECFKRDVSFVILNGFIDKPLK